MELALLERWRTPKLGAVPHIPPHEDERRRALQIFRDADLSLLRTALRDGCYPEILESLRRMEPARIAEVLERFLRGYPRESQLVDLVSRYTIASAAPQMPIFALEASTLDWSSVTTGPRDHEPRLLAMYQHAPKALLHFEIVSGLLHASLEPIIARIGERADVAGAKHWQLARLQLDLRRTVRLASAEILAAEEPLVSNRKAIEDWSNGLIRLWMPVARFTRDAEIKEEAR